MRLPIITNPFFKKFWPLILVIVLLLAVGVWYRFWGPGDFNSKTFKAYNTVLAAIFELRRDPDNFEAAMRAGVGYYNLSKLNKAEEYYLKAAEIDPAVAIPWNNLGNTYRELIRYEDAEAAYERSISIEPDSATSYLNLVGLYNRWPIEEFDRRPKIPAVLNRALEATNRDIRILRAAEEYFESVGNPAQAEKYRQEIELREAEDESPPQKT